MDSPDIDIDAILASYVSLSSLPTPPPSYEKVKSEGNSTNHVQHHSDTSLHLESADYLRTILPANVHHCITPASSLAISTYLKRLDLPNPIIGLTTCILESLSSTFIRSWRQAAFYARFPSTRVETIVLAVLSIATGFLDDTTRPTRWWSEQITEDDIRIREINVTVRCILQDTNYDIHSFTAKMIADAVEEMKQVRSDSPAIHMTEWASKGSERVTRIAALSTNADEGQDDRRDSGYGGGEAVWRHGVMTPEPSPPLATAANRTFLR